VSGLAIHDYEGDLEVLTELKETYPDKTVHLTERSVWGTQGADRIARYFRNWCSSYNAWVTMLDSSIGPHQFWMTPDTTLYVRRQFSSDDFWATPDLYLLGNFARFVRLGFVRIESDYGSPDTLTSVAFLDPSGQTVVLVLINPPCRLPDSPLRLRIVALGSNLLRHSSVGRRQILNTDEHR
jgi:O-glycosyl hydrolase